ncbi:hypothetical protein BDC45DRAFT_494004, partial [Circinella umbellata]
MNNSSNKESKQTESNNFIFQHPDQQWKPNFDIQPVNNINTTSTDQSNTNANEQNKTTPLYKGKVNVDWDDLSSRFEQNVTMSSAALRQSQRQESFLSFKAPLAHARGTQEERRRQALERQKSSRQTTMNTRRREYTKTEQYDSDNEDEDYSSSDEEESNSDVLSVDKDEEEQQQQSMKRGRDTDDEGEDWMDDDTKIQRVETTRPKKNTKGKKKKNKRKFKKQEGNGVMYGESLDEVPHDFYENWVIMPYPTGKRCILTTGKGETIARRKNGSIWKRFQSMLPNGSKGKHDWKNSNQCILDCIYDPIHWTFYILDVMCWKGYSIYDCDTDFRHFWLQTKVESEMDTRTTENMFYKFKALRPIPMTEFTSVSQNPQKYMNEQGYDFKLDGILFYHRETRYIEGSTPLVIWVPGENNFNQLVKF